MEVKQRAAAEERVIEQQAEIERLQKKLSNVGTELEIAFGSAGMWEFRLFCQK